MLGENFTVYFSVIRSSGLGPLLFLVYVNDLSSLFEPSSLIPADDVKVYMFNQLSRCKLMQIGWKSATMWPMDTGRALG